MCNHEFEIACRHSHACVDCNCKHLVCILCGRSYDPEKEERP